MQPKLECWFIPVTASVIGGTKLPAEAELLACLSEDELQRQQSFTHTKAAKTNLISRGMLRLILSRYAQVKPKEWQFVQGQYGKPGLAETQRTAHRLAFNVSHSGEWLCIAVLLGASEEHEIGVDIERFRDGVSTDAVLSRFFARAEVTQLQALPDAVRVERFFDLWALKESYIKASGQGLACPLDSFSYDINDLDGTDDRLLKPSHNGGLQAIDDGVAWTTIALSGNHQLSSRFVRLTDNYRVALTCNASLDAVSLVCRIW